MDTALALRGIHFPPSAEVHYGAFVLEIHWAMWVHTQWITEPSGCNQSVGERSIHQGSSWCTPQPPSFFLHLHSPTQWIIPAPKTDMSLSREIHIIPTWTLSSEEPSVSVAISLDRTCPSVLLKLQLCVFLDKKCAFVHNNSWIIYFWI